MAASPPWKVYGPDNDYLGSVHHPSDAAAIIAAHGQGTIRWGHKLVTWREGAERISAGESYDEVAYTCYERRDIHWQKATQR